ncbi:MAG: ADOP family duplicated permease [Gemmatimonadota bacterium]
MDRIPRLHRWLLRGLPAEFRERHGADLEAQLAAYAQIPGWRRRFWYWTRSALDLGAVGLRMRLGRRTSVRTRAPRATASLLDELSLDVRHAFRGVAAAPRMAFFVVATVALGVGVSATVFGVANTLFLKPLPFADPARLVFVSNGPWGRGQQLSELTVQVGHLVDLQTESRTLSQVEGYHLFDFPGDHTLTSTDSPERVTRLRVTGGFLAMLGVRPDVGRLFTPEEASEGGPPAILLTHALWVRRFGKDPSVIGSTIGLDGEPVVVVGVLPASFDFPAMFAPGSAVDYVAPWALSERNDRTGNTLALVGRLASGATLATAQAEIELIGKRHAEEHRNAFVPSVVPLRERVSGGFRAAGLMLTGGVVLVMLIVCANLSNLLLARASQRSRELAVRAALGAGRGRLSRQLLSESLVLASIGGLLGAVLALLGTRMLANLDLEVPLLAMLRPDWSVVAGAVAVAALTGALVGLLPALRFGAPSLELALRESGRSASASGRVGSLRSALVLSEIALASVLLVGSTLLAQSVVRLLSVDLGYQPERAAVVRIDPARSFAGRAEEVAYLTGAVEHVRASAGVAAAGLTDVLPMAFNRRWSIRLPAEVAGPATDGGRATLDVFIRVVSEGYLEAMGLSLLEGRDLAARDDTTAPPVAVINDVLAGILRPSGSTLGAYVETGWGPSWEVIGMVQGTRHLSADQEPGPEIFLPIRQNADFNAMHLVARGAGDMPALLRAALQDYDRSLPLTDLRPVRQIVDDSTASRRFLMTLVSAFALFGLLLASLGVFGVVSYQIGLRKREIGIRVALGATAGSVQRAVLLQTAGLAGAGALLGITVAWALSRVMESLLFQIRADDPVTLLGAGPVLVVVALAAAWLPARAAARVDPLQVLGCD